MITELQVLESLKPKDIDFIVDVFEDLVLRDLMTNDNESLKQKLKRDLTDYFSDWLMTNYKEKKQTKVALKGETRSGKSLIGLKIVKTTTGLYPDKIFDTEKIVCANQRELRQKLQKCEFGDSFLVDENAFANVGPGSITELQQLKDINNITAKNNNHIIYITPKVFLDVGASIGLSSWGRDSKNWLSRFLLYSLKGGVPQLLGYVIFDLNPLFIDTGCLIYKQTGGCTNSNRLKLSDLNKDTLKYSKCIPSNYDPKDLITDTKQCPFYNICLSQMCKYEHKKDKWIEREFKGGFTEREYERYQLAHKLFISLAMYGEKGELKLKAKNGKEIKLKVKMKLPLMSNAKFTGVEFEEITQLVMSMVDEEFFNNVCEILELNPVEEINKISPN